MSRKYGLLLFVLGIGFIAVFIYFAFQSQKSGEAGFLCRGNSMANEKEPNMKTLEINVDLPKRPCHLSDRCIVRVRITNRSSQSVLLNKRLSVGYRNSLSREIFIEIFKKDGKEIVSRPALLYERQFSVPKDYKWVRPDETISTSFDLFEWYNLPSPGNYEMVIFYQADEELADKPADLLKGVYSSDRIALTIMP